MEGLMSPQQVSKKGKTRYAHTHGEFLIDEKVIVEPCFRLAETDPPNVFDSKIGTVVSVYNPLKLCVRFEDKTHRQYQGKNGSYELTGIHQRYLQCRPEDRVTIRRMNPEDLSTPNIEKTVGEEFRKIEGLIDTAGETERAKLVRTLQNLTQYLKEHK